MIDNPSAENNLRNLLMTDQSPVKLAPAGKRVNKCSVDRAIIFSGILSILFLVFSLPFIPGINQAKASTIIRDAEIEGTLRRFAGPVIRSAGISEDSVSINLLDDPVINAFVSNGQTIFVTTGLVKATESPTQLIGVLAHEMGHVAGGHLVRLRGALENAQNVSAFSQVLGIAAGLLSGNTAPGAAVSAGGAHIVQRSILRFSRVQEQSADQAAVNYMEGSGLSSLGIRDFLLKLKKVELLSLEDQNPYTLTHPLTENRIKFVENHIQNSKYKNQKPPPVLTYLHNIMRAKIIAFTEPPDATLAIYSNTKNTEIGRYALAIAHFRNSNAERALALITELVSDFPRNPFYREFKGQILLENGKIHASREAYQGALGLAPGEPLIMTSLAHALLALSDPSLLSETEMNLKRALQIDPKNPFSWRLLAMANGRGGKMGLAALAQAEYSLLSGNKSDARTQARRAIKLLRKGQPGAARARDILHQLN